MERIKKGRSPAKENDQIGNRINGISNLGIPKPTHNTNERKTINPAHHFSADEKRQLIRMAKSQEDAIRRLFRKYPEKKYHFYDIQQIFGFDKDSTKRSLSNLSNRKPSGPWRDGNGETPLVKLDEKRVNPKSGIRIHLYQANPKHGKKASTKQPELFPPNSWGV